MTMLTRINSKEEMIEFIKSVKDDFGCNEDWEEFFGFHLAWDEETGEILETIDDYKGEFENIPEENEYPIVLAFLNIKEYDRWGSVRSQLYDWISIK